DAVGWYAPLPAAPGVRGTYPRPARHRRPSVPSTPWACAARSSATAAAPGPARSRRRLDALDLADHLIERTRHDLMHTRRIVALDEIRAVTAAPQIFGELLVADAREHRRVGDLVAVQVQDGQHRPVGRGIQELVAVPAGRERTGLGLAIADHAGDDEVGIVEHRPERVTQRIAELAPLVDGPRRLRRHVARNAAREGELLEE